MRLLTVLVGALALLSSAAASQPAQKRVCLFMTGHVGNLACMTAEQCAQRPGSSLGSPCVDAVIFSGASPDGRAWASQWLPRGGGLGSDGTVDPCAGDDGYWTDAPAKTRCAQLCLGAPAGRRIDVASVRITVRDTATPGDCANDAPAQSCGRNTANFWQYRQACAGPSQAATYRYRADERDACVVLMHWSPSSDQCHRIEARTLPQ